MGWVLSYNLASAQCPQASFTLPDTVCINEPLSITNTSIGATRYEWDFCSGDLEKQPSLQKAVNLAGSDIPIHINTISDGPNWYSFICSRNNSKIFRLDFGSSLDNTPVINDLGNPNAILNFASGLSLRKEGNDWYGLLVNILPTSGVCKFIRLAFGNSLTNIPTATEIPSISAILGNSNPRKLDLVEDNGKLLVAIPASANNTLYVVNFGNSITNNPLTSDVQQINLNADNPFLYDVQLIKECSNWYGIVIGYKGFLYRLEFGNSLLNTPLVTNLTSYLEGASSIPKIEVIEEQYPVAFFVTATGQLFRLSFTAGISASPVLKQLDKDKKFNDAESLEIIKSNSNYIGFLADWNTNDFVRIRFSTSCFASSAVSNLTNPTNISFSVGGWQKIDLIGYNSANDNSIYTDSVFVRPQIEADFTIAKQCAGRATEFEVPAAPSGNRIKSYSWNFGDGNTATGPSVPHPYAGPGTYTVTLTTEDVCNKTSTSSKPITIYKNTIPDFPAPAPFCSNQPIAFTDASTVFDDTPVSWQWNFGNGETASEKNPVYSYPRGGNYSVTLTITGISGCAVSITKPVSVKAGAAPNFITAQECLGFETRFTDQTVIPDGTSLISRLWDFGDGNSSTDLNPVHTYATTGSYAVKLTIENSTGCTTTRTKNITIRRPPTTAFSYALACAGEPTLFTDESSSNDGSIASWVWNFGDPASQIANTSIDQHPAHTFNQAGTYSIKLKVFSQYGCVDSLTKTVTVLPVPVTNFDAQVNCQSREVSFNDLSSAANNETVSNWYWDFGDGGSSTERNPKHTYQQTGDFTVILVTTGSNRCTHSIQKVIQLAGPSVAQFTFQPTYSQKPFEISFTNTSSADVMAYRWDFGDGQSSTQRNPVHTFANSGVYAVSLTVSNAYGCTKTVTREVIISTVTDVYELKLESVLLEYPPGKPPVVRVKLLNRGTQPISRLVFNTAIDQQNGFTVNWHDTLKAGALLEYEFEIPVELAGSSLNLLCVQAVDETNGKTSNRECVTANEDFITLPPYPNPAIQRVTLAFWIPQTGSVMVEVIDALGRRINCFLVQPVKAGFNEIPYQLTTLRESIYFVRFSYKGQTRIERLFVQ